MHAGAALRVAGSFRCVGWRVSAGEKTGLSPGADPCDQGVDLLVREHSAGALGEGGHRGAMYSIGGGAANGGIVGDREENGVAQRERRSSVSIVAVASGARLRVEDAALANL